MKNILFICRHNVFRSKAAEGFFKKYNKNKKYRAGSAGLFKWDKASLGKNKGYKAEKKVIKDFGIKLGGKSRGVNHSLLKRTDIIVIVSDDIPHIVFTKEDHYNGKVVVWKIKDVKKKTKDKGKTALQAIKEIEKKVKKFVREL